MKRFFSIFAVFSILLAFFVGCDNFLNSSEEFTNLMETEIDYAKAPLINVLVGHNSDDYGTVGSGVVNYSITAKVGYAFTVNFAMKATAGNFVGWNAYTQYDPDIPANCKLLDKSYIEFVDNSQGKLTAQVKILKKIDQQVRLVPEVSAFPVMEICLPTELVGISPSPATFNPAQPVRALTPGQEYMISATTTVDYGFSDNPDDCWKVYRKDVLGNEIEISDGDNITISKNTGTQLANGRSQSSIYITVDEEFSGRFYVSPKLITFPSMKVDIEDFDPSLVKMSHSGTVSMAKGTPYEITLQTDPSVGFKGWKLCKKSNASMAEIEEIFPADSKTTTNLDSFVNYSDEYIEVSSPSYEVSETGKNSGKVNASIQVILREDMDDLEYSYYLIPQFFKYPVVNVYGPDGYASAGRFSLTGAGYLDNDSVRMMMNDYEYTITYKTTEDYSFADPYWIVYETADPSKNLLDESDSRIELTESSIVVDESGTSTCSVSVILKHNFGTTLNIKPVVAQKPSMSISFADDDDAPNGINLSLGGSTITSGSINSKIIKMSTGKTYTATVNVPKGYSFEGWRLVRANSSNDKRNWITESTKTTTDIVESATIDFDSGVSSENPADYVRLFNAKYTFEKDGRNAGTTKATVDISFKKELSDFSLNLIPVIKAVPEISFVAVNSDYGNLLPAASDVRNLYPETKIELMFKSTKQATAGKEIWKVEKWNSATDAYVDYGANIGYTHLDLTAALNDEVLKTKDIIIYNNDNEAEVQPNSKGEYITTKTAVLYVNRMPEANLQLSVEPEVYNTIKFVPGTNFEATAYDSETYIPAGVTLVYELKSKPGYFLDELVIEGGQELDTWIDDTFTDFNGVTTVKGYITSSSNNGDTVVFTPCATPISKVTFGQPVLSSDVSTTKEDAGSMVPSTSDFIYQVDGNSTAIRFETSGEYTYEGFTAGTTKFVDVSEVSDGTALYVLSTGTLAQARAKAPKADIVIHDLVTTELADSQGQVKNRVTGTLTVVDRTDDVTVKPLVKGKPAFYINVDAEKGSVSPSVSKKILINEDYNISYISSAAYGFEKWSLTNNGSAVSVLSLTDAKGTAGTSATSFVVDLGTVQELTGSNSLSNIQTALGTKSSKLLGVIYNTNKVESQAIEGVETVTAIFRIVKDTNSTIEVSPITYRHSYFYIANNSYATVSPASTSKVMVKKGKDYDFRIVTNTNYMYKSISLSGATVENAGNTTNPDFASYTTQDAVCYNIIPTVNKDMGTVTVTGKIRILKEFEDTIIATSTIESFPRVTVAETNSGETTRITLGSNTVSGGSISASLISDYEKNGTDYDSKYLDYAIEVIPSDSKGIYSLGMFSVFNSSGTRLGSTTGLKMTSATECPAFASTDKIILYDCHLVQMENGNYKAAGKIRCKSGEYTIKPGIYNQPTLAIQSVNPGDIISITFEGQRINNDSISAQNLYSNGENIKSFDFSIKLKEGIAAYTDNLTSANTSLKAFNTAGTEMNYGDESDYIVRKESDYENDDVTTTVIHECEQTFDGTNYVLAGKIRTRTGTKIVLKPNVYTIPVINFDEPSFGTEGEVPGKLLINNITQNQSYSSPCLISKAVNFSYTALTGYYIKEFKVYNSSNALKSTYTVGPSSITAGSTVAGLEFSNLGVASATRQKISGTLTIKGSEANGYKIVPVYEKGSLGPTLVSCELSYYPVTYTNTQNGTYYDLTNATAASATKISENTTLSPTKNQNYYIDSRALAAGGTQIASNEAKYTSTSLKNVFTGETGSNSFSVSLKASNANFPGNEDYVPVRVKVTEKLVGLYANMYYMTENDEKSTVRITSAKAFDSDLYPKIYSCAGNLIETCKTITTAANFTSSKQTGKTTTVTFTFGLNFNIPFGGIHQFEISAIDSKGNETEKRTICLEYPRPEFKDSEQGANLKNPAALRKAGGTTVYARYITDNDPTSTDYPYLVYYSSSTSRCHFTKPYFSTNGYDETVSILKRSTASQSAYIRLANRYGFLTPSRKTLSGLTTSIAGPGDIVYRKLNSTKKYVCSLDDYLENPSIGEPIALIVSGTGYATNTATSGTRILGMGLKVPTQDYYYPGKLKFFNDVTETLGTGDTAKSYQVKDLIKTASQTICGTSDGMGKDNLETYQGKAFNPMQNSAGLNVDYTIKGSNARESSSQSFPAFSYATHYSAIELNGFTSENWYIPTVKEFDFIQNELSMINNALNALNATPLDDVVGTYWTSTTGSTAKNFYTYQLNLLTHYFGIAGTTTSQDITTYSTANYVRVFYDFTGELETE